MSKTLSQQLQVPQVQIRSRLTSTNMADYELYLAAREGNLNVVKSLLGTMASDAKDVHFQSTLADCLVQAIWNRHYHVVEYLLSLPETPVAYPFEMACAKGDMKVFSMFINKGVNVNPSRASWDSFSSPLICAVENNQIEIVKALIEHGVNINATNGENRNALDYAIMKNNSEMVIFLRSLGMKPKNVLGHNCL